MKRSLIAFSVILGLFLATAMVSGVYAADKAKKEARVSGRVHMINKDTSTITVRAGTIEKQIVYSNDTKFTYRNAPSSLDEVKDGRRVIALGQFEGVKLMATRIDVRDK